MVPSLPIRTKVSWFQSMSTIEPYDGPPRNIQPIDEVRFDGRLRPKNYEIFGTHPDSKILITDVRILDSTEKKPYRGDVLIEGALNSILHICWRQLTSIRRAIHRSRKRPQ